MYDCAYVCEPISFGVYGVCVVVDRPKRDNRIALGVQGIVVACLGVLLMFANCARL